MEKKLKIAIDVDGVLRNNLGEMVKLYNEAFDDDKRVEDVKDFKTEHSFPRIAAETGVTASQWFFQMHSKELFLDAKPYDHIAEDIKKLQEIGEVIIVTYQKTYLNKMQTLQWLEKNNVNPDGICFLRDKTSLHADILIDDNPWNFLGTHVQRGVLIDAPYNEDTDLKEIMDTSEELIQMGKCKNLHEFVMDFVK